MTRNEQIKEQLKELPKGTFDSVADYVTYCAGFYDGVAWADAHPDNGLNFKPKSLDECIEAATPTWKGVDVEKYIDEVRGREPANRWISVEDELPPKESEYEDNSIVVLATDGNDVYKGLYRSGEYLSGWFTCDLWGLDDITHWMLLPSPPKKGGEL